MMLKNDKSEILLGISSMGVSNDFYFQFDDDAPDILTQFTGEEVVITLRNPGPDENSGSIEFTSTQGKKFRMFLKRKL